MYQYSFNFNDFLSSSSVETKKIGRIQFTGYFLILIFFSSCIWYILTPYIQLSDKEIQLFQKGLPSLNPQKILFGNIAWIILYGLSYYFLYGIVSKRYIDIGWTNRTPKILIIIFILINLWSFGLGAYSAFLGNPLMNLQTNLFVQILGAGVGGLGIGSLIGIILMCFCCIVFPGLNHTNEQPKEEPLNLVH